MQPPYPISALAVGVFITGVVCEGARFEKWAGNLPTDDVRFLRMCAAAPRLARLVRKRPAPEVFVLPIKMPDLQPEDLLDKDPTSNLTIAACGPRAAGKLLAKEIREGRDR